MGLLVANGIAKTLDALPIGMRTDNGERVMVAFLSRAWPELERLRCC